MYSKQNQTKPKGADALYAPE